MDLTDLKKRYAVLEKKYKLPDFKELNENFEIEKIRKGQETLLRTIRKTMMEKIINSMGFIETLINPINAPRIYLVYIKSMSSDDRKDIEKIYSSLSDLVIGSLGLEIDYEEEREAEMIKRIAKSWDSIKPLFRKIVKNMQKPVSSSSSKEKSYFG
ncbi:MAG: hypothetical protein QXS38_01400 [Candidatus Pacearchaeota archaeon]